MSTTKYTKLVKETICFYQLHGFDIESPHQNIGDWVSLGGSAPKSTMIVVKKKLLGNDNRCLFMNGNEQVYFGICPENS
jgi:hypothetical protein